MKSCTVLTTSALVLAVAAQVYGQEKPPSGAAAPPGGEAAPARSTGSGQAPAAPPVARPSPGLLNEFLRARSDEWSAWDIGGQSRTRYEFKENLAVAGTTGAADFRRNSPQDENNFLLLRERLHVGYAPVKWFTLYGEAQSSSTSGDERNPNPEANGLVDVRQAYLTLGTGKFVPFTVKIGRQELLYGDERLVGSSDWNNLGRVFDAAKLRYQKEQFWVDGFMSRVVIADDNNLDLPNDYDWFSGVYASTRTYFPRQETQVYFLVRNVSRQSPNVIGPNVPTLLRGATPRDIYTAGTRIKSLPGQVGAWDYEAEFAAQWGDFAPTATAPRLDHEAFAAHLAGGYTWAKTWGAPRFGLEYNYASGDDNPNDGEHGTFENLFPTNHKFYGFMDFFSWQNVHDLRASASLKPHQQLSLTLDYHAFWLADTHDSFYQVNGAPRNTGGYGINPSAGGFVGHELDLVASYAPKSYATLQAGYGHFFTGEYVRDSLAPVGGATDANWFYLQAVFNF